MTVTTLSAGTLTQTSSIDSKKDLIKRTICKNSSDDEFELFIMACKRTGLDPFMKQIYAVKRWSSADKREVMSVQTSIDGFRLIAERTGKYSPGREPTYVYGEGNKVISSTAYVKKQTADGTWHEVAAVAYFEEYVQRNKEGKPSKFWEQMPHVMLAKCAESLALRKAFPADLSGIYTSDEMSQSEPIQEEPQELTEAQCAMLDILLCDINDKDYLDKLHAHLKVETLYEIKPRDFDRTIRSLEKRVNAKQKEIDNGSSNVA